MNASVSRFRGTRRNRAPRPARMGVFAVLAATLAMGAIATPSEAHLIRIDGDYLYMTEDFESVNGPMTSLGYSRGWGNGFRINADDLWHEFEHRIATIFGEDPGTFPYESPGGGYPDYALVDNVDNPERDGMALLLRKGHQDTIRFGTSRTILEFSCDVFLVDIFGQPGQYADDHCIDFVGTEGRLRYYLSFHEVNQHVRITEEGFGELIGELESVRIQSRYGCIDNLTVKTWLTGSPPIPEPGCAALLASLPAVGCLRRRHKRG